MNPTLFTALTLVSVLTATAAPGDWPTWRGPKRDGLSTETGLLKQWPAGGPPLAWKATGCGTGYSSVSVADGRVITMGDGPDGARVLFTGCGTSYHAALASGRAARVPESIRR